MKMNQSYYKIGIFNQLAEKLQIAINRKDMSKITAEQLQKKAAQELYSFRIKSLEKQKEKIDKFYDNRLKQAWLLKATQMETAHLRCVYITEIDKIKAEITEIQKKLDSIE